MWAFRMAQQNLGPRLRGRVANDPMRAGHRAAWRGFSKPMSPLRDYEGRIRRSTPCWVPGDALLAQHSVDPCLPRAICASLQPRNRQVSGPRCRSRATQIEQSVALQTVNKGWVHVTSRPFSGLMTRASRSSLRRSRCSHTPRPRRPRRRGGVAGRDHWGFAGPGVEFAAVVHEDVQPAGEAVVGVRLLAAADAGERLDVLDQRHPAPALRG